MTRRIGFALACGAVLLPGCATVRQVAALRRVDFSVDRISGVRLAGIDVLRVRSARDLSVFDAAGLATAIASRNVPLELVVHVRAENPADNPTARLMRLEWTMLLDERETVSGALDRAVELPAGAATDVPVAARMNLVEFYQGGAADLVTLARALAGEEGVQSRISLRATPIIDTPLGAIRYPQPITIVRQDVGR